MPSTRPALSVDAILARSGLARIGAVPLLTALALTLLIPGFFTLPPMDRDEPRFAQASKQMLESADLVAIRFGDEARNKKPVGIHWLQVAAVLTGETLGVPHARRHIWLYRIPSLAGAVAAVLLTFWAAAPFLTPPGAALAAALFAATPLLGVEARLATTDAVLAASVVAAMGALARAYLLRDAARGAGLGTAAVFWVAIAAGVLLKGPVTPLVAALAVLVLCWRERSGRWLWALRPAAGLALCLLAVAPWFVLILVQTKGAFLADAVGHDLLGKVAGGQEMHGAPPGFYALTFWLTGWPLAPFVLLAAPALWRLCGERAAAFLLAWIVPAWLVFELVTTKLVHYALPLFPGLAIAAVYGLERGLRACGRRSGWALFVLLATLPTLVLGLVLAGQGRVWSLAPAALVCAAGAAVASVALGWRARAGLVASGLRGAVPSAVLAAVPLYLFVYAYLLTPGVAPALAVSPRLAAAAGASLGAGCPDPLYATVGDREPSLMFATDARLLMTDAAGAARFLEGGGCRAAFVDDRAEPAFKAALDRDLPVREVARIAGIAVNGGKALDIAVYVRS